MGTVVHAAAAVALGTGIGHGRPSLAVPLTVASLGSLLGGAACDRFNRRAAAVLVLLAVGAGAAGAAAWRTAGAESALLPRLASERGVVEVCGVVRSMRPRSVEVRAERVERSPRAWKTNEPLRVAGDDIRRLRPGEWLCATGELRSARPGRKEPPIVFAESLSDRRTHSRIRVAAGTVRAAFSRAAQRVLPDTQAGLLLGMTEGDVALLGEETMEDFRTTGLAHLVAVSGSNVAMVLVVVMLLARSLARRSRWVRVGLAMPALVFFAFLTALEASVLRATVTAVIALVVAAEGRTTDGLRMAALAFVVLVLASPELEFHPGFQLSFAATLGLILWARPLTERIDSRLPNGAGWTAAATVVGTTLAAQIAAAPLLAFHFERVPAFGGLANLIVAPLAPIVMVGGMAALGAASLFDWLAWTPLMMRLPLDLILWCGRTFARLPAASLEVSVLIAGAASAAMAGWLARTARGRRAAAGLALVLVAGAGGQSLAGVHCPHPSVTALDVGQGTAVLLKSGDNAVLVDGGPESGGILHDLREAGVKRLDAVYVSHPHADHTQGVVLALERLPVGAAYVPATIAWGVGKDVVHAARRRDVPLIQTAAGDAHRFGDIEIEVVYPPPGPAPEYKDENAVHGFNLVLRARVGGTLALLPGDIGVEEEQRISEDVSAAVFVAPHHGSKDLDPAFVEAVSPELTLVSVGADNSYGHPAPEALASYSRHGRVFRTDTDGTVAVCLAPGVMEVVTEK